jgi:short-subunit dehydrogenase
VDVNLGGVLNTILPAIPLMKQRHFGQLVLIASLAGYAGLPSASGYCASKAAVRTLGESLRAELMSDGIHVNVVSPGFVETHTKRKRSNPLPFLVSIRSAIDVIADGIAHDVPEIAFPWQLFGLVSALAAIPRGVRDFIARFQLLPGLAYKSHPLQSPLPSALSPGSSPKKPIAAAADATPPKPSPATLKHD